MIAPRESFERLESLLSDNHYKNKNGCWLTDYQKIAGLKVHASSVNGTSGTGIWQGRRVYWHTLHLSNGAEFQVESA